MNASVRLLSTFSNRLIGSKVYPTLDEGSSGAAPPSFAGVVNRATSVNLALTTGTAGTLSLSPTGHDAWAPSTAYNAAPKYMINGYKVFSAGRSYELNQNGVSAATGGPTGTTQAETDNTARWGYMGEGNGGSFNTANNSLILTMVTRGNTANAPTLFPTDVTKGEDVVALAGGPHSYSVFPQSGSICHLAQCPIGASNHVITWEYGLFAGGSRDEISAIALNLTGVNAIHRQSFVERTTVTGGKILSLATSTTKPTLVCHFVLGEGNVVATGTKHSFVPTAPCAYIPHADTSLALDPAGYIQTRAYYELLPGAVSNYQAEFTTTEPSKIYSIFFELAGPTELPADAIDGPTPVKRPYFPEHFPLIAAGITEPDYLWSCDNSIGNLRDRCNDPRAVLTARTNVSYSNFLTGWTRPFVGVTLEATGNGFNSNIGELWNIGSQSVLCLFYAAVLVSGGNRCLWLGGGANGLQIEIVAAGQATSFVNAVRTTGTFVYENATPTVYPFAYHWDRRGTGVAKLFTNKEAIVSTWANLSDNAKGFGSPTLSGPQSRIGLCAVWVGANAEAMMDRGGANLGGKTLIADMGWPMAF